MPDEIALTSADLGSTEVTIIVADTDVDLPAFDWTGLPADEPADGEPIVLLPPDIIDEPVAAPAVEMIYAIPADQAGGGCAFPVWDYDYYAELWGFDPAILGFQLVPLDSVFP